MGLLLEAVDVTGPLRWRWLLSDEETGNPIADHSVQLDPASDEVTRFRDLYDYVYSYAAPDQWAEDEARFVHAAGAWAGRELLGESIGSAIMAEAPVTIRVKVPAALDSVLLWPLELAHASGKPLAAQGDITLVYDVLPNAPARRKSEVSNALRMLAVFSQPTKTSVLALRRERYALSQLIRRLTGRDRAMVQLQVVQYGVTRERLREIADSSDGWDVLHLSGHGAGGVFWLEQRDGSPDPVQTDDLLALLRPVRRRVKLAVVSACESAADTTAQTLRLLGLTEQAEAVEAGESGERGATQIPGLARALVRELDCAVVAMRYPVADEFAIAFGDVLYEHLFSRRQPVDLAAARAVAQAADPAVSAAWPALSVATPGVFGTRAAGLTLPVPRGRPDMDPAGQPMAYFPSEPARFVGRAAAMAAASAALAPRSGQTAVLLHGMAGAGKTACALELAYRHADVFAAAAFWQAPTREEEWPTALADLANRLEIQLGDYGFTMASHIGTVAALEKFLPRLRRVMEERGVLLVLDNLETLLTPDGGWRDPRWELLITALTSHDGESRVIMTSRIAPTSVSPAVVRLPVHALSLEESVALARELPNLRSLLHADAGPVRAQAAVRDADRERVRRVLRVVQGHPKLMELADAAADDRNRLDTQLAAAEEEAAGHGLEAFLHDGTSTLDPEEFLAALRGWTVTALEALSPEARLMAEFVACLEDTDRLSNIIGANWADLWRGLDCPGDAPAPRPLLDILASAALVEAEPVQVADATGTAEAGGQASAGDEREVAASSSGQQVVAYRVHPGVAAAILGAAGPGTREATDAELATFWGIVSVQARDQEGGENSGLVVRAGLAASPYLLRRRDWETAGFLLDQALLRDESPGTVQAALPTLRRIVTATGTPQATGVLARALGRVDLGEAEAMLRGAVDAAVDDGDYRVASGIVSELVNLLMDRGRLEEALEVAGQKEDYARRAALGPWTQLMDQARSLQILGLMGQHEKVLAEVGRLRAAMAKLPDRRADNEAVNPWSVREGILDIGRSSALAMRDWQQCLELNAEIVDSAQRRGAGVYVVTRFRYNDASPLIRLGRLDEAGRLLAVCQRVFEEHGNSSMLSKVLSSRADVEAGLGRWQAAADLQRTALRLRYITPESRSVAIGHHNLASCLGRLGGDRAGQRAHRLAAALIRRLAGMSHDLADTIRALAGELREDSDGFLPSTVAQVIATAELTEGVRLGALLAALQPDMQAVVVALAEILRAAAELPPESSEPSIVAHLRAWDPVIAAVVAVCATGRDVSAEESEVRNNLRRALDELEKRADWTALVGVLRRILAGERGESLLDGLDAVDTAIVRETLSRLTQPEAS